jgi:hypothetical protein
MLSMLLQGTVCKRVPIEVSHPCHEGGLFSEPKAGDSKFLISNSFDRVIIFSH